MIQTTFSFIRCLPPCALLLLVSCVPPEPYRGRQPEVRVALILAATRVRMRIDQPFILKDLQGNVIARNLFVVAPSGAGRPQGEKSASLPQSSPSPQSPMPKGITTNWMVESSSAPATVRFSNTSAGSSFQSEDGFEVVAESVALFDGDSGNSSTKPHTYSGRMRLVLSPNGMVQVINILPVEEYLSGVVRAEMNAQFPLEALKAQAVASRSSALVSIQRAKPGSEYDICAGTGCQVYLGNDRRSPLIDRAVQETYGMVLKRGSKVMEAPFSSVCGGHTEKNESVWSGNPASHLRGVYDGSLRRGRPSLVHENEMREWIGSRPAANCNLDGLSTPAGLNYARKYFRWEVRYSSLELAELLRQKTGEDFGELLDLEPLERGVSGRITKLRVIGTRKSFEIQREFAIRQALSQQLLWSSAFVIDKVPSGSNGTHDFVLRGAGSGHGVGMCQTGAAQMALNGASYLKILRHYYSGVGIGYAY